MPTASEVWGSMSVPGYAGGQFYINGSVSDPGMTPLIPTNGGSGLFDAKETPGPSLGGIVYNSWYSVPTDAVRLTKPYLIFFTYAELSDGFGGWVRLSDDEIQGYNTVELANGPYRIKLTPNTYNALVGLKVIQGSTAVDRMPAMVATANATKQIEAVSGALGKFGGLAIIAAIVVGGFIVYRKV